MADKKTKKASLTSIAGIIILAVGLLFFLLRGPYLSNSIKRILVPVLENATRERIIIDKAVINLFPFYVQAKGFKVFDKDGNRLLWITKTRAYIDLLALFSKEIRLRKLTLKEPELSVTEKDLKRIIDNMKKSTEASEKGKLRVSLKNLKLTDGKMSYRRSNGVAGFSGRGLFVDMVSKNTISSINMLLKELTLTLPNESELHGALESKFKLGDRSIEVSGINIRSSDSTFNANGELSFSDDGTLREGGFDIEAKIFIPLINKIFALKQEKDGLLAFTGSVDLVPQKESKWPGVRLDLKTESHFYLETLMEILRVKADIRGRLSLAGKINGAFPALVGKGTARLDDGFIAGLPLDDAVGRMAYKDRRFTIEDFTAYMYGGGIKGDAHILIPSGDYSVIASASEVNSQEFFKFLKWASPFPQGEINADFQLSHRRGHGIEVMADMKYLNATEIEGDILSRLETVNSTLSFKEGIISLENTILSTSKTDMFLDGRIDLGNKMLDMFVQLQSRDVRDITAPYYSRIRAPVRFKGDVTGPIGDPEISGRIEADSGSIHDIRFTKALADITYTMGSLHVGKLKIAQEKADFDISGRIDFRESKKLFSFKSPFYMVDAELADVDIKPLIKAFYRDIPVSGLLSGTLSFEGAPDVYAGRGDLLISESNLYGQQLDRITLKAGLSPEGLEFQSLKAYKGASSIEAKGRVLFDEKFDISVSSEKFQMCDFGVFKDFPYDAAFKLKMAGSGTLDNPDIVFSAEIDESLIKGIRAGKGDITGTLKDKKLRVKGTLLDGLIIADAQAEFSEEVLWNVDARLKKGRYDSFMPALTGRVSPALEVLLEGGIKVLGRDREFLVNSRLSSVELNSYGYNLRNEGDIVFEIDNEELRIKSFFMTGNNADLSATGTVKTNKEYDLAVKGNLDIAPFMAFTDRISSLRGRSSFSFDITGPWKSPEIMGEIEVGNASASFIGFPYIVGPVNGSFLLKKDRITFDSVNSKFAGGTVVVSGAAYFEDLSLKRFFMSADIRGLRVRPVEGLNTALDAKLFYELSSKGASLTGNVDIKKARYDKRVEWKSWLLGLKEIKDEQVKYPEFLADTVLNIHVEGSDHIIIDNNIARTPVKIILNVTGTVAHKGLLGRVEADRGTVYFRSNEFKILEGSSVDFVDPDTITTVLHILAETYINNYYVRLSLDGTMDKFTLSLFSDPPLSEPDILALLTVGQLEKGGRGIESGIAAGEATAILTGSIQDKVEEQFKYITGLERFEIEPHTTTEGAFVPKVIIEKRLFEDKLFVVYSTAIGTTEESSIKLEYKLSREISIVGSRNEIGSAGLDIKYRFEFK